MRIRKKFKIMGAVLFLGLAGCACGCTGDIWTGIYQGAGENTGYTVLAAEADSAEEQVAGADEMAKPQEVLQEGMSAVFADELIEGTYPIEVRSSSSMFRIHECFLTVKDGKMQAVLVIQSDSYLRLFMGTGAEAVDVPAEECITFEMDEEGNQRYTIPVEALDQGIDCAAFSRRREKWYDRTLVFPASSLPQTAFKETVIMSAEALGLEDGTYTVEAALEGGSGKTVVENPVVFSVKDGEITAIVTIKSKHYNYVLIKEQKYEKINVEGNSAFEIPIDGFDWKMPFTANSTAMNTSHEIEYTLFLDSETIQRTDGIEAEG